MKKIGLLLISVLPLAACSQFASNGDKQYLQSRNGVGVVVPSPLTDSNISHFYDLPSQNQNPLVSIAPPSAPEVKQEPN
ncbi:hypothetical protein BN59_01303 [Legionella massiliensis]|uniref:Outer membrane protein assembly factor BamC n=1 Tax=Legionella massiliensis TaxID=1034943 RepID=A0A078KZ40_9GAMM|nr:hypothetical protein [Legionella massiliensis]CDZ77024.1 hypothetical protein BN59_01303 [Legionella massiliensis]CEE12762.1 hypothetical protein BN1094_01303 [Legionella massiliensis]